MKDELCKRLLRDKSLRTLSVNLAGGLAEDLIQEVGVVISKMSEDDCKKISPYFNFWCVRTMINLNRPRAALGKLKKKELDTWAKRSKSGEEMEHMDELMEAELSEYDHEIDNNYQEVMSILDKMYWYDRELFLTYHKEGSLRKAEKLTKISYSSIYKTVKKVQKHIKEEL